MVYPDPWYAFELETQEGRLFSEKRHDFGTCISVEITDLPTEVTAEDLPLLREGFLKGLKSAPGVKIEREDAYDVDWAVGVEAVYTFDEGRERRKRWVRVLYKGRHQYRLVAQGRSEAEYERWLDEFKPALTAFQFDGGVRPFYPE